MTPLLSVIVPIYNSEKYLSRCIESILSQTYTNLEVILVDDGSTDGSLFICEEYQAKDSRIKLIHQENRGSVSARKAGISLATAEYVIHVDSDDWIEKNMYENMMGYVVTTGADIVVSGCIRDYGNHVVVENGGISEGYYAGDDLREKVFQNLVSTENFYCDNVTALLVNKLCKRRLLAEYELKVDERITLGDDLACSYPCILSANSIYFHQRSYYHYCMHEDSLCSKKAIDSWKSLEVLFHNLKMEMAKHVESVPNILEQFEIVRCYYTLLKHPEKIVKRKDNQLIPFGEVRQKEKVIVYGAGRFGCELIELIKEKKLCEIVGWVDKKQSALTLPIEKIDSFVYDKIIIAVLRGNVVEEIRRELNRRGISQERILFVNV